MRYCLNCCDEPIFMAVSKPLLTEFGIHHRLESCEPLLSGTKIFYCQPLFSRFYKTPVSTSSDCTWYFDPGYPIIPPSELSPHFIWSDLRVIVTTSVRCSTYYVPLHHYIQAMNNILGSLCSVSKLLINVLIY